MSKKWSFWIDRGGTFTDIVARNPNGQIETLKLLSKSDRYKDAVVEGIRQLTGNNSGLIGEVRMGTTVATNAFLENKGARTALVTTLGFIDLLEIRGQRRPNLFELCVQKQKPSYDFVTVVLERMDPEGNVLVPLDEDIARFELDRLQKMGVTSLSVSLMHSTVNPIHELILEKIALEMGFQYVSLSHRVSPIGKLIPRAETSTLDASLSPVLLEHTQKLAEETNHKDILFMQSHGGLCRAEALRGHNALLSGPAGGYVGATKVCQARGYEKVIAFDMGGTSTDVALFDGKQAIEHEPRFHGLELLTPMLDIHTVAAGGGSILFAEEGRLRVGPESAGADPGPACYGRGGPLTVTDANLFLGRIQSSEFPQIFGANGDQPLNENIVRQKFNELASSLNMEPENLATNFLDVAVETMAGAIRTVSVSKGHDPQDFVMCCFGGAGAQLACKVAEKLGIKNIFIHRFSSLLSAYGMGLTEEKYRQSKAVKKTINQVSQGDLEKGFSELKNELSTNFLKPTDLLEHRFFQIKQSNGDHFIEVLADALPDAIKIYRNEYQQTFGFPPDKDMELQAVSMELAQLRSVPDEKAIEASKNSVDGFYRESQEHTCVVIDQGWSGKKDPMGHWFLEHRDSHTKTNNSSSSAAAMEISYQRLQTIAEEMGEVLKKTGYSVNIRERLDYSCAIFTDDAQLVANAPHMPVHLGSMSECVLHIHKKFKDLMKPGDSYIANSPLEGGTHLPDITVVTPVFISNELQFYVASRGHHADIGGISPGSMPAHSKALEEEGVVIESQLVASQGEFLEENLTMLLSKTNHPARNVKQNLHDIKAQLAANRKGISGLELFVREWGLASVKSNIENLLSYTSDKLKKALSHFTSGEACVEVEGGRRIQVRISNEDRLVIDFSGTSASDDKNFHAPRPVTKAAVLYCLRCLLDENIPLNDGLARSLEINIPKGSLLDPGENSAVVAGNVETSQIICDAIFSALGVLANSQGTMNNVSLGSEKHQYYETLGGGMGAGPNGHGASGLQVHMTNSQLTDPEVLESRFPLRLHNFSLRRGSGGSGKSNGGDGLDRRIEFLDTMEFQLLSQRRVFSPQGLEGGFPAMPGSGFWETPEAPLMKLAPCQSIEVGKGTQVYISTPGGGGYGMPDTDEGHFVFAYGSNLDERQFTNRCPSARVIGRARLFDHSIHYSRFSPGRQCGVMDIYSSKGHTVWGLIYSINDDDLKTLDRIEGHPDGYTRVKISATMDDDSQMEVWVYDVPDKRPHIEPSKIYRWHVYRGATRINAPHSYLKLIGLKADA